MAVVVQDGLMQLGGSTIACKPDAELARLLELHLPPEQRRLFHVLIYQDESHVATRVVLQTTANAEGIVIGGPGPEWHLGTDDIGPLIEAREYVAGTNKMSNPIGDPIMGTLYWYFAEGSGWALDGGAPGSRTRLLRMLGVPIGDDVARSTEPWSVKPGQVYETGFSCRRPTGAGVGRLRLRAVYTGQFQHPDVLEGDGQFEDPVPWTDISEASDDAEVVRYSTHSTAGLGAARIGPTTHRSVLVNGSFEDGFTNWAPFGAWVIDPTLHFDGVQCAVTDTTDADKLLFYTEPLPVTPGEKWRLEARIRPEDGTDGVCTLSLIAHNPTDDTRNIVTYGPELRGTGGASPGWVFRALDLAIDPEYTSLELGILIEDHTTGFWAIDDVRLDRVEGNTCALMGEPHPIAPGRTYDVRYNVESDAAVVTGSLTAVVHLTGPGRPEVRVPSSSVGPTSGEVQGVQMSLDVPSGYDTVTVEIQGRDIEGGSFWLDELTIADADSSTRVHDAVRAGTGLGWSDFVLETTAPQGAETIHVEGIAEAGGDGWEMSAFFIARTNEHNWTSAEVVADLLRHPDTGASLLAEGTIVGPETIIYDWTLERITSRTALRHLSRAGVADPVREWRVNPATLALDWDTAEGLYVDRTEIVLEESDQVFVLSPPQSSSDLTDTVQRVIVVGERVTGVADVGTDGPRDWFGHPVLRTTVIDDSSVDQAAYASSLAAYELGRSQSPRQTVRLRVGDWRALGTFGVGDWVYVFAPDDGLVDPANERRGRNGLIYPAKVRVVSMSRAFGDGKVVLRRSDGTTVDISRWVQWDGETAGEIEVGDPAADFVADPQAGAVSRQFARFVRR